jgi:hypothetical protein
MSIKPKVILQRAARVSDSVAVDYVNAVVSREMQEIREARANRTADLRPDAQSSVLAKAIAMHNSGR